MLGSVSFRRAISLLINLLYAVSFFLAPPLEDLAANNRCQHVQRHAGDDRSGILFFTGAAVEFFATARGGISKKMSARG